jgi:SRSO17 transposase
MPKGKQEVVPDAPTATLLARGPEEFEALCGRIARHIHRQEVRRHVRDYLLALLAPVPRKNGWQVAQQAGQARPHGLQRVLNGATWDADRVRDDLQAYVQEHLGHPEAVLVLDETGFLKKGRQSVGVQRQYSGTAGRIENCQIGVFLAYATPQGRTFLDRELYLPREWAEDAERRKAAGVPEAVEFATKPQLARRMLERARTAGISAGWVTADTVYGGDRRLRIWLEEQGLAFVLEIACKEPLWTWTHSGPGQVRADALAAQLAAEAWERLTAGDGAKGPRVYDWARVRLFRLYWPGWEHWLLVRRSITDPQEVAYYVVFAPEGTPLATLVQVAGTRWSIEECFETGKGEVGLDQYEVRKWEGWYRFITLALLAHAYLAVLRAKVATTEKGGPASLSPVGAQAGPGSIATYPAGSATAPPGLGMATGAA